MAERKGQTDAGAIGAVVFGSDQGLVGQFNDVVADYAIKTLAALPGKPEVWAVGERVHARLADAGLPLMGLFAVPNSVKAITPLVGQIQIESEAHRAKGEYARTLCLPQPPAVRGALRAGQPAVVAARRAMAAQGLAKVPWPTKNLPEVMGGGTATLRALIREYLFISLFRACAESLASENASRLAAMQRADKNIDELLEISTGLPSFAPEWHRRGTVRRDLRLRSAEEELRDEKTIWKERYRSIVDLEEHLHRNGTGSSNSSSTCRRKSSESDSSSALMSRTRTGNSASRTFTRGNTGSIT
jgi:alternate F1F0 ATPase F1 subunit gamma